MNRDDEKVEFLERVIFGKAIHGKNINEAIELCFKKANQDASRPFKNKATTSAEKRKVAQVRINACKKYLKKNILKAINSSKDEADFDNEHKSMCYGLLDAIKQQSKKENVLNYIEVYNSFGYAQKVINLTYKYLFATDHLEKYKNKINFLHATIDSKIIDSINDDFDSAYKDRFGNTKWSKILSSNQKDEYTKYLEIQKIIRKESNEKSAFMWELATF